MSILLLAECWPYRNTAGSVNTSQTRLLAQCCGLSVEHLLSLCRFQYVLDSYVPSFKRQNSYEADLRYVMNHGVIDNIMRHDITIIIGKRLMHVMSEHHVDFFKEYFTYCLDKPQQIEMTVACIPNPMAEFWWKESTNLVKVFDFMHHVFKVYGNGTF